MISHGKRPGITVFMMLLACLMTACGATEEPDPVEESSTSAEPLEAQEVEAYEAVSVSSSGPAGPDPANIIDVQAERGSYTLPVFEDDPGFRQVWADTVQAPELFATPGTS